MIGAIRRHSIERLFVILVAVHSFSIGIMLLFFTGWTLDFAGWQGVDSYFFPRQGGVFHLIVAVGYFLEHRRHDGVTLMVMAKSAAVVFLLVMNSWDVAWSLTFSGILDGLMLAGILVLRRLSAAERRPRRLSA